MLSVIASPLPRADQASAPAAAAVAVVGGCSPAALSEAASLGLSLLADFLGLPDSWDPCLALKALALNNCWSLAHADQVNCD
jgi:hypothetical protein